MSIKIPETQLTFTLGGVHLPFYESKPQIPLEVLGIYAIGSYKYIG